MTARKGVTATKFTVSKIDATVDIPDISSWKPLNFWLLVGIGPFLRGMT